MTPPRYAGRHWFYNRNSGLQRQSVVFTRETLNGSETVALDPNRLSPDGSVALSGFVPAPDAQHFAYGQAEGGSDWSTYYIRELGTGLPDAASILHPWSDGVRSALPAASIARTSNRCVALLRPV